MTYSYEFTQKAEEDLEVILDYLTKELKNQQAAKKFLDALHECVEKLASFPRKRGAGAQSLFASYRHSTENHWSLYCLLCAISQRTKAADYPPRTWSSGSSPFVYGP